MRKVYGLTGKTPLGKPCTPGKGRTSPLLYPEKFRTKHSPRALYPVKPVIELKRPMKAKLKSALISNVDPFFFALACAVLFSVSITAIALADDVLSEVNNPSGDEMMITTDGQLVWNAD